MNAPDCPPTTPPSPALLADVMPDALAEFVAIARRLMHRERVAHTLQPTALAAEAYLKLSEARNLNVADRPRLLAAAAEQMRRILIDHARKRDSDKRGGGKGERLTLSGIGIDAPGSTDALLDVLDLEAALVKLEALSPRCARVVVARFYADLSVAEVAVGMGIGERTVEKEWQFAKRWLHCELSR